MPNQELERRLETSGLAVEDQIEIRRVFEILSEKRKIELFDEWSAFVSRTKIRRERLEEERTVLILDPLAQVAKIYEDHLRFLYKKEASTDLHTLQTNI